MTPLESIQCTHSSTVEKSCFMSQHFCPGHLIIDNRYYVYQGVVNMNSEHERGKNLSLLPVAMKK